MLAILFLIEIILLGMVLGSFIGMAVVRIPTGQSIVRPRSRCVQCQHILAWYENIPIFSYLFLRGRCRHCQGRISPRYLVIEVVTTAVTVLAFFKLQPLGRFFLYEFCFILPMLLLMFLDWEALILPDAITLPGIALGFLVHWVDGKFFFNANTLPLLLESLLGALAGFLSLLLLAVIYQKLRKQEGLGGGDIKLAAMIGAFFGWKAVFFIFLLASVTGSLLGLFFIILKKSSKETPLPFGTFLTAASLLYLFYGPLMLQTYLGWFGK